MIIASNGSSSVATLSFALQSKGEAGQPSYLIIQAVAVHFRIPPPLHHKPWNQTQNAVIYMGFMTLVWKNHFLQHAENGANTNTSVLLPEAKKHRKYRGFGLSRRKQHWYLRL